MGAGCDGHLHDATLPPAVPLVRMVDECLGEGMTEYIVMHTLAWHRNLWSYDEQQTRRQWMELPERLARDRNVGILGLGTLGMRAAVALRALNFQVCINNM